MTFTIRTGVKWSDGSAFTPADVAATFNGINDNPAANVNGLPTLASPATVKVIKWSSTMRRRNIKHRRNCGRSVDGAFEFLDDEHTGGYRYR